MDKKDFKPDKPPTNALQIRAMTLPVGVSDKMLAPPMAERNGVKKLIQHSSFIIIGDFILVSFWFQIFAAIPNYCN